MKKVVCLLIMALILVTGCNNGQQGAGNAELIDVMIEIETQPVKVHEEVMIKAKITQGKEVVTDATEVKFEIWRDGYEEREMVEGEIHPEEEVYFIHKIFHEPGLYYVIAHVTARNMHNMPKLEVEVMK